MKKLYLLVALVIMLASSALCFYGCNNNSYINVTLDYDYEQSGCVFEGVKNKVNSKGEDYYESFNVHFTNSYDNIETTFKFKSGATVNISCLTTAKRNYKVDKIFYLDKKGKEVILYSYQEGDYSNDEYLNDTHEATYHVRQWENKHILPNYNITIHIEYSLL